MKKQKEPDGFHWVVDVLGNTHFLDAWAYYAYGIDGFDINIRQSWRDKTRAPKNGLYFNQGHWTAHVNDSEINSYKLGHQQNGTAHFCQSFALLYYASTIMGKNILNFKVNDYSFNVELIANELKDLMVIFSKSKELCVWLAKLVNENLQANKKKSGVGVIAFNNVTNVIITILDAVIANSTFVASMKQG